MVAENEKPLVKVTEPLLGAVHKNQASPFEGPVAALEPPENPEMITGFAEVSFAESNVGNTEIDVASRVSFAINSDEISSAALGVESYSTGNLIRVLSFCATRLLAREIS